MSARGYRVSFGGGKNVPNLGCGIGFTALNILGNTEECTFKE